MVFGYILYEEFVWERIARPIVRFIQSLKILQKIEAILLHVNGTVILFLFVTLFVVTELLGLYSSTFLVKGQVFIWALIYVGRLPLAAFTFWLFKVTKPKLMAFHWFAKAFNTLMGWIDWVKATDTYKSIKTKSIAMKTYIKKNYLREGDSANKKFKKIYTRLKIRLKGLLGS